MKTENENKRTKRKEIQFSEVEYAVVEQKACLLYTSRCV